VSKAFTKDDDNASFEAPPPSVAGVPTRPFRLTFTGARIAAERNDPSVREALARAETLPRVIDPERAALGVTVLVRDDADQTKRYRLVSPEERALVGEGCSIEGPIGSALIGATVGEVREVALPRGACELEIIELEGERKRG
jgi:transcription elongation GreA/GreB family factor